MHSIHSNSEIFEILNNNYEMLNKLHRISEIPSINMKHSN